MNRTDFIPFYQVRGVGFEQAYPRQWTAPYGRLAIKVEGENF